MSTPKNKKSETAAQDTVPSEDVTPETPVAQPETAPTPEPEAQSAPQAEVKTAPELKDVDELIIKEGLPAWQGAALCRAEGWAPGKKVTADAFAAAVARMTNRRMGG